MLRALLIAGLLAACPAPASAWIHGSSPASPPPTATLNIGAGDVGIQLFVNLFNAAQENYVIGTNSPAAVDQYGFPVANFTSVISGQLGATSPNLSTTGPYTFGWDAGRSCFRMVFLKSGTASNITNATVTNGSGAGNLTVAGDCTNAGSITINWVNTGVITYQFDNTYTSWASNTTGRMWLVRSGNTGWNGQSDLVAWNAGTYWTKEAIDFISALKPAALRTMGLNAIYNTQSITGSDVVSWNYRKTTNHFSWLANDFPPGTRCGSASGGSQTFCTATVSSGNITLAPATDTNLAGWTDGEQITFYLPSTIAGISISAVANNGGNCQITVSDGTNFQVGNPIFVTNMVNSGGVANGCNTADGTNDTITAVAGTSVTYNRTFASGYTSGGFASYQQMTVTGKPSSKLMVDAYGQPFQGDSSILGSMQSGYTTATYNAVLDKVIVQTNSTGPVQIGISNAIPFEAQAQLANLVSQENGSYALSYWYNIPPWANDAQITNTLNVFKTSLNANIGLIIEWANENWNTGQSSGPWSNHMASALGIGDIISGRFSFQGLRNRQIFGNLLPASNWGANNARVERYYGVQNAGSTSVYANAMNGVALVSPGTSAYQSYVGGAAVNYNQSGSRPVDFIDSFGGAPYTGGGTALSGQSPDASYTPTSFDASLLNSIISAYTSSPCSSGVGDCSASSSLISQSIRGDNLNRTQTVTASGATFTTPAVHNFAVNDLVRFTVSGGTTYSGLDLNKSCVILTTPTTSTFTCGQMTNGVAGAAVNAGSVGTGTTSVGYLDSSSLGSRTIFGIMNGSYTKWQDFAVNTLSPSPAHNIKVRWYEANPEPTTPSVTQCNNIGVTSTNCGTVGGGQVLDAAITAYKGSTYARSDIKYYYQTFMGTVVGVLTNPSGTNLMTRSAGPSHLVLQNSVTYSLNANGNYMTTGPNVAAPNQWYYGFQDFNVTGP